MFEAIKVLPDEVIAKRFRSWGWVIGRNRNHDICPVCIGVRPENKLADRFKVTVDDVPVPNRAAVAEQAQVRIEATQKSVQAGLLKLKMYRDISEDLKAIRLALEKIAEVLPSLSVAVPKEDKKAPTKKVRAKAVVKKKPSELVSKG